MGTTRSRQPDDDSGGARHIKSAIPPITSTKTPYIKNRAQNDISHTSRPVGDSSESPTGNQRNKSPVIQCVQGINRSSLGSIQWKSAVLSLAACHGNYKMTKFALSKGAPVDGNSKHCAPLHLACREGHLDVIELLLHKGAQIDNPTSAGCTPLFVGSRAGNVWRQDVSVVKLLLSRGADVEKTNREGLTPLMIACYKGNFDAVDVLLTHGAHIDARCHIKATPLYIACQQGHRDIADMLLSRGACIHALTQNRDSPMHIACYRGHLAVVELLLSRGAHLNAKDGGGRTPLAEACERGHPEIVTFLLAKGAWVDKDWSLNRFYATLSTPVESKQRILMSLLWSGLIDSPPMDKIPSVCSQELAFILCNFPTVAMSQQLHMTTFGARSKVRVLDVYCLRRNYPARLLLVLGGMTKHRLPWYVQVMILKKTVIGRR